MAAPLGTLVRNTFIEFPASPNCGMPSPMASAPAKCAFSLKESLAEAVANADQQDLLTASTASSAPSVRRTRMKPEALTIMGPTSSMTVIPESPKTYTLHTPMRKESISYVTGTPGPCSIPPTPLGLEWGATPSGTPAASIRQTLSLVEMIQSPKGETKSVMYPTVQQTYMGQPTAVPLGVPAGMSTTVSAGIPTAMPASVSTVAPPVQPLMMPTVVQQVPMPQSQDTQRGPSAAVQLGLVSQQRPAASVAVGTIALPQQHQQYAVSYQMPVHCLQPATMQQAAIASPPHQVPPPPLTMAPSLTAMTAVGTQPQLSPPRRIVPPPPVAPAPTVVMSPKAHSIPLLPAAAVVPPPSGSAMPEADFKVLLDMAVSSGNQQAVDALLRQAQQGGMSPEQFNSMLAARS